MLYKNVLYPNRSFGIYDETRYIYYFALFYYFILIDLLFNLFYFIALFVISLFTFLNKI